MEEKNNGLTPEKKNKQRKILKAQNQLLDESRVQFERLYADDPEKLQEKVGIIDEFKKQNLEMGLKMLGADKQSIENETYNEPTEHYKEVYKKRLAIRGITDEEMRRKDISNTMSATISSDSKNESKEKKKFSFQNLLGKKKKDNTAESITKNSVAETVEEPKVNIEEAKAVINEELPKENTAVETKKEEIKESVDERPIPEKEHSISFNAGGIPDYIQYDIIELPSKGECYKHKKSRIPVRYLTAADENLITSPNMYANGTLVDTILKRCILDPEFNVDEMCQGDRDAVVLWLRMTAFGNEYNVNVRHPKMDKSYETTVDLSSVKYKEFKLKGDKNGYFDYKLDNGDVIKWKILSTKENSALQEEILYNFVNESKYKAYTTANTLTEYIRNEVDEETKNALNDAVEYIKQWANPDVDVNLSNVENNAATRNLIAKTVSINGNTDEKYITDYINNLKIKDSIKYRKYMNDNTPGVDMSIHFDIPESDGGGSIDSFLRYYDDIFINGITY